MPAPQPQAGLPQPFSQATLSSMRAPSLISKKMPAPALWWTRLRA